MQALLQCCAALVKNMGKAEADAALQGPLMPALVKGFQHSCADVRKSVSSIPLAHPRCRAWLPGVLCPNKQHLCCALPGRLLSGIACWECCPCMAYMSTSGIFLKL